MWRDRLVRELGIVLVIKLVALYLLWRLFFSTTPAPPGEHEMEHRLLNQSSVLNQDQ